ncbi:hypothetical protein [Paraburkholderia aspalathi]|uniref:RiboL-PSP-HEPN domain-containing protein n=1 Tax=Paraburkholderia aspalathi TaxID=1324617 RepID=A0A1I7EQ22_9BURK|nr:hypothetical protein [Paraburkholderia aspalathi]SFU26015.1 hypothetical protein SAMN05192563_104538 [Paraburkholderia aspalathi]
MSTIAFNESMQITMRTYLSMNYLTSAALLARKAHALEAGRTFKDNIPSVERDEHFAFVAGAITMSAAAVEAFVNELFAECRDQGAKNQLGIAPDKAVLITRVWIDVPKVERESVLEKYDLALRLLDLPALDRKGEPYKAVDTLLALRNSLMHYKLVTQDVGKPPAEQTPGNFEKKLQAYFADNPLTGPGNPYFPDRVMGHGAAEWSVSTAVTFLDGYCHLLSATPPYEHLRSTFATQ